MSKRLITTTALVLTLAATVTVSGPAAATPSSPGACNMLHASDAGLNGMMNDKHVFDIMIPLVEASLGAGCIHP